MILPPICAGMHKLLGLLGLPVGGWIGGWVGARVSIGAALFLGVVGTGLGLYVGRRIARDRF